MLNPNRYSSLWTQFLDRLNREALADEGFCGYLPSAVLDSGWLGQPPATEEELAQLEKRIGVQLPPSYRSFLATSNGWLHPGPFIYGNVYRLLPASRVGWFRDLHADWIEACNEGRADAVAQFGDVPPAADEDYFVYGPKQNCHNFPEKDWTDSLAISDEEENAIYLLNPNVVTAEGEWEAWFFASWMAGADRYRSFWELMHTELESSLKRRDKVR